MTDVATFDLDLELPLGVVRERRSVWSQPQSGTVNRRQTQSSVARATSKQERRLWDLRWSFALRRHYQRLKELSDLSLGGALSLTWTPPGESSLSVRIVPASITVRQNTANHYELAVTLQELV